MDEHEKALILQSIECWRHASVALEDERHARLRAMTNEDTQRAVIDLLSIPLPELPDRGSGLVEQQRSFHGLK